jgi:homogentisate 1,2-dioxygenase
MPDQSLDKVDFVDGLKTISGAGSPQMRDGLAISVFTCNKDMGKRSFYNSDGDFLIGELILRLS